MAALRDRDLLPTEAHLDMIRAATGVAPSGIWGTKGSETPEQTMVSDFERYGIRFKPVKPDAKTYHADAVAFAAGRDGRFYVDTQFFKQYGQPLVAKWDEPSREFILITTDGAITTYTSVSILPDSRYLAVPDGL